MAFLRIKPVRKPNGKVYHYVYEVESYKHKGKVRQRTLQLLGPYVKLKKQKQKKFPLNKALQCDSKELLLKEIFAHNLANYGFVQGEPDIWRLNEIMVNLNALRVSNSVTDKDVYLNINEKFFGTHTLKNVVKSDNSDLFSFAKAVVASGALNNEDSHDRKVLEAITVKFLDIERKMKEADFDKFAKEIGY